LGNGLEDTYEYSIFLGDENTSTCGWKVIFVRGKLVGIRIHEKEFCENGGRGFLYKYMNLKLIHHKSDI
jgi:hypothetical protein